MGEHNVRLAKSQRQIQIFEKHLLKDIRALERMLEEGWFDDENLRIGAEQEFCIIDNNFRPAPRNQEILDKLNHPNFTTEFSKYNAEINCTPREFKGKCLSEMHAEIDAYLALFQSEAEKLGVQTILCGILPTVRKFDISMDNLTPLERYRALCKAINKLRGDVYELKIRGIDELIMKHDSPLLEACNTGFQVHLQIEAAEFVKMYNIAQAIAAPVLAACVNSPLLFGKRLWMETRTAIFQQSVDTRNTSDHLREFSPRVTFGNAWLKESVLEIYKEDIIRYRILLSTELSEDVMKKLDSKEVPLLEALNVHNSTIYRWNRPCYGISNGKAHLRIENRILPAGPSTADEMANAALWLGLMKGLKHEVGDVTKLMDFDIAKSNFANAAQHGLDTQLTWFKNKKMPANKLVLRELLPIAKKGLKEAKVDSGDIDYYLGIVSDRVKSKVTGSQWILNSYDKLIKETTIEETMTIITAGMVKNQKKNLPVSKWKLPGMQDKLPVDHTTLLVEEFMSRDLFTVQPEDIIPLVAEIMDWKNIRYVAVEDEKERLVGLVTSRLLLRHYSHNNNVEDNPAPVKTMMIKKPITIVPEATIKDAMEKFQKHGIGCLPVVNGKRLIGIITAEAFMSITQRLMKTKKD
ncbi:MAG TPA: CBS domain-containing protein [Flavobacteriales bacterium]|nr:CBS domain-containing protein [Flavobacteriales bacterium]